MKTKGLKYYLIRDKESFGPYNKKELSQYVQDRRVSLAEVCREAIAGGALHRVGNVLEDHQQYEEHLLRGDEDDVQWELRHHEVIGENEERQFDEASPSPDSWERHGESPQVQTFSGVTVPNLSRAEALRAAKDAEKSVMLYYGHPSLWYYAQSFFWAGFLLVSGVSLWQLSFFFPFLGSAFATWILFITAMKYDRRHYLIDNRRVEVSYGIFNRTTQEIPIRDIHDTRVVRRGLFQSIFKLGDVVFNSPMGKNALAFRTIKDPDKIKEIIRKIQSQSKLPDQTADFYGLQKNGE